MNEVSNWKPEFPETNDRMVGMCNDEVQTFSVSREVGIIVTEDVEKQSPACFWIDEQNVYLRMNWGTWYKVSNDSPETISAICRRHTAKLTQVKGNCSTDCFIPVFHLDRLPMELFVGMKNQADDSSENTPVSKPDDRVRLAADLADRMGEVISEYKKGDGEFILARGKRHLMLISFFVHWNTEWLADEESFNGDPPLWFSEAAHLQSPLYIVKVAAEYLKKEFDIDAIPVVILADKIDIINLEDILKEWRKTGVQVCYCQREDDVIPIFDQELFANHGAPPDDRTVAATKAALEDLVPMSPKDWEKFLQRDDDDITASTDDAARRRYCLGKYHSDEFGCDFQLGYDFHQLLLLPDESSDNHPTPEALAEIGKRISQVGVYSEFGLTDRELPDDSDEARINAEVADRLFKRYEDWMERPPYTPERDAELKDWLIQIERFWRRGNPVAFRDVGISNIPLWSIVFETEPAALLFQYPDEEKWREHTKGMLDDYIKEYASITQNHQELSIFYVVILESAEAKDLQQLNTNSPPGMFFVSPENLNETVMKIFMTEIFNGSGEAD
ncbi:MAG: hypothetical protein J5806_02940 [Lentisphaeria bacterium]|nr:hypothetical protein [Lentisphaeria bacterium]